VGAIAQVGDALRAGVANQTDGKTTVIEIMATKVSATHWRSLQRAVGARVVARVVAQRVVQRVGQRVAQFVAQCVAQRVAQPVAQIVAQQRVVTRARRSSATHSGETQ
jgi:hypothetical protein